MIRCLVRALSPAAFTVFALAAVVPLVACGKGDPDDNFRLWSNNEQGWQEMAAFVADRGNDLKLRVRALEILIDEGGQPSQVPRVVQGAQDKVEVLMALQPALQKMLENPNTKKQGYGKRVMFEMLGSLPDDKKAATRKAIAKWAFDDLSMDDKPERVVEKLGTRIRPDELEALGDEGVYGAEIMLSKGISRDGALGFLQTLTTNEAKLAIVNGLRRYHTMNANVKVTESDLAAIQRANIPEGLLYYIELYLRLIESKHPDDQTAASQAIAAATQWADPSDDDKKVEEQKKAASQKQIKDNWDKFRPVFEKLLVSKVNCDDRWWGAQMLVTYAGVDGLKYALANLPDDKEYGQESCARADVKMMLTDWCSKDIKPLGADVVRPVFEASLASARVIERIAAVRCLGALGDDAALAALKAYATKKEKDMSIVDPVIVPQDAQNVTVGDLAAVAAEVITYGRGIDKLAAEGKVDADSQKWRKHYAAYSFERKGKVLISYVEGRAAEKIAHDKAKKAAAGAAK